MKFLGRVVCMVATLSGPRSLLLEAPTLKLAEIAEDKSRKGIWSTCFAGKRAALFHGGYVLLDVFADA